VSVIEHPHWEVIDHSGQVICACTEKHYADLINELLNQHETQQGMALTDFSEVTCSLQRRTVQLNQALNDKEWNKAEHIAKQFSKDMIDLTEWINRHTQQLAG
jgi:hypothetical protein